MYLNMISFFLDCYEYRRVLFSLRKGQNRKHTRCPGDEIDVKKHSSSLSMVYAPVKGVSMEYGTF